MAESELVRLIVVPNPPMADLIRNRLQLEGIQSMRRATDFGAGSVDGMGWSGGQQEILVRLEDLEAARALIADDS